MGCAVAEKSGGVIYQAIQLCGYRMHNARHIYMYLTEQINNLKCNEVIFRPALFLRQDWCGGESRSTSTLWIPQHRNLYHKCNVLVHSCKVTAVTQYMDDVSGERILVYIDENFWHRILHLIRLVLMKRDSSDC